MTPAFVLTSLVVCLTPGVGVMFTLGATLARGARAGLFAAFASTLGTLPHAVAALTGLAAVLQAGGALFELVRLLGIAYLLWMAWQTWNHSGALAEGRGAEPHSRWTVITTGITANLLNPKLTLFFFAFLPQFIDRRSSAAGGPMLQLVALSIAFMVLTFLTLAAYVGIAAALRDRFLTSPGATRRLRRIFAVSFVALSARLAVG
jgi:threonine/homoserine/homoserine lactone efflux protein